MQFAWSKVVIDSRFFHFQHIDTKSAVVEKPVAFTPTTSPCRMSDLSDSPDRLVIVEDLEGVIIQGAAPIDGQLVQSSREKTMSASSVSSDSTKRSLETPAFKPVKADLAPASDKRRRKPSRRVLRDQSPTAAAAPQPSKKRRVGESLRDKVSNSQTVSSASEVMRLVSKEPSCDHVVLLSRYAVERVALDVHAKTQCSSTPGGAETVRTSEVATAARKERRSKRPAEAAARSRESPPVLPNQEQPTPKVVQKSARGRKSRKSEVSLVTSARSSERTPTGVPAPAVEKLPEVSTELSTSLTCKRQRSGVVVSILTEDHESVSARFVEPKRVVPRRASIPDLPEARSAETPYGTPATATKCKRKSPASDEQLAPKAKRTPAPEPVVLEAFVEEVSNAAVDSAPTALVEDHPCLIPIETLRESPEPSTKESRSRRRRPRRSDTDLSPAPIKTKRGRTRAPENHSDDDYALSATCSTPRFSRADRQEPSGRKSRSTCKPTAPPSVSASKTPATSRLVNCLWILVRPVFFKSGHQMVFRKRNSAAEPECLTSGSSSNDDVVIVDRCVFQYTVAF